MSNESWSKVQFDWLITKFSSWRANSYSSPQIQDFNGKTWSFTLYPNSKNVGIALVMEDHGERITRPYNVEVVVRTGDRIIVNIADPLASCARVHLPRELLHISIPTKHKREELEAKLLNDTLTCSITISSAKLPPPPLPDPVIKEMDLISVFASLLNNPRTSDVAFLITSSSPPRTIYAHSSILSARSSYFRAMFESGFAESSVLQTEGARLNVEVSEFTHDAFFALLTHLYTNRSGGLGVPPKDLFLISDHYGVEDLREQAERAVLASLEPATVVSMLFEFGHRFSGLRAKMVQFVGENFDEVDRTGGLARCLEEYNGEMDTDLIVELFRTGRNPKT